MITASRDDCNPAMKSWDCRASATVLLDTLARHSQGVPSVA